MKKYKKLFTSEAVSIGHPDRLCDMISDAILDACLITDPNARVACETMAKDEMIILAGEITTSASINVEEIAKMVISKAGYTYQPQVIDLLKRQSPDIARGVDIGGAGDQGIMFGFACDETLQYMPLAIVMAHDLMLLATKEREEGRFCFAKPDMKAQVTLDYTNEKVKIHTILMSVQHEENYVEERFKDYIIENIMKKVALKYGMNTDFHTLVNPTGRFVIGGPQGDTGLTGRKIIVDTYGRVRVSWWWSFFWKRSYKGRPFSGLHGKIFS